MVLAFFHTAYSQDNIGYQKPPQEILELVDVELAPRILLDDAKNYMIFISRDAYKSIEELSKVELRLGGLRIDPKTNIGSRTNYYNNIRIRNLSNKDSKISNIEGLPKDAKITNFSWSPDQTKIAFTNTTTDGVAVWVIDLETATAKQLTESRVNANIGDAINWFEDGQAILVKMVSNNRKPLIDTRNVIPQGPVISENMGKKAQNRTYQDLLTNKNDEFNFEQLAISTLYKVDMRGHSSKWLADAMYAGITFSPDGEYVMISTIEKPFSYLVTYSRFPSKTTIYTKEGRKVETVLEVPLIEDLPQGFMAVREGRRNLSWRSDKSATLVFAKALDGGNPETVVPFRDEVFEMEAPFKDNERSLLKTKQRYVGIQWGTDQIAIATDYWWNTRNIKSYLFNPSNSSQKVVVISDRNYQDKYNDPGSFVTERNSFGSYVLSLKDDFVYLVGEGYTKSGQFPFIDKLDIRTLAKTRVYQSKYTDKKEDIRAYDVNSNVAIVSIESPLEYPNYYLRDFETNRLIQWTDFRNPFIKMKDISKEVITYKRDDGLELSGTLYLPPHYDKKSGEKLPMILWAYPREFKDKSSAGQNTQNPNEFTYPYYGSMIYWAMRGYAVLDDASFPIVGEGDTEPNDSFRKQLVANAKAAIDTLDSLGYIDRDRVAVGGHSYGAFMVANLLSHSDLFAAGIARSGAYNRTLTPFGFQSEERNYWEAPDVYNAMSPFMNAEKMKYPLLLIHGEADNNSGTYPMQSERYFNALKGLGATVRLVMLPKESHGYAAKESILHLLWEQDQWLEKYVKSKKKKE